MHLQKKQSKKENKIIMTNAKMFLMKFQNMVLLLGDMNEQVESNRQGLEHAIGPQGIAQQTNDNGD